MIFLQTKISVPKIVSPNVLRPLWKVVKAIMKNLRSLWSQRKGHGSLFINDTIKMRKLYKVISSFKLHEILATQLLPRWGLGLCDMGPTWIHNVPRLSLLFHVILLVSWQVFVEIRQGFNEPKTHINLYSSISPNIDKYGSQYGFHLSQIALLYVIGRDS